MIPIFFILTFLSGSFGCINNGSTILRNGITDEEIDLILSLHNTLRANVALGNVDNQERGKNMLKMRWDNDLAKIAQEWADNCVFKHDYNLTDPKDRFGLGQNLARSLHVILDDDKPDFNWVFNLWADEKANYNYSVIKGEDVNRTGDNQTLHYTQIVSARTFLVGCGYSLYMEDDGRDNMGLRNYPYGKFYVCNYGPLGNIINEYPYEERDEGEPLCDEELSNNDIEGLCEFKVQNTSQPLNALTLFQYCFNAVLSGEYNNSTISFLNGNDQNSSIAQFEEPLTDSEENNYFSNNYEDQSESKEKSNFSVLKSFTGLILNHQE